MDSDDRFKHLVDDPRFKKIRKQRIPGDENDERFKAALTDEKFTTDGKDKRGFLESDVSSSSDESDSEDEVEVDNFRYDWQPLDHDAEQAEKTTRRLAIQNLDWDHLDVQDIFTLVNSIRMPLSVRIYLSQFGRERLAKELKEGPEELANMSKEDEDEEECKRLEAKMKLLENQDKPMANKFKVNEYEDADEMVDSKDEELRERIRQYQLKRMKYYYAIAEFDSIESAEAVYNELDGMEYEGTSLELDLRFVPDEMQFDASDMKSECDKLPDLANYKAPQFIHSALQQTTVKFTWDETDIKRQEKLRRAYTKEELEKDDLDAYLASETDDDDDDDDEQESDGQDLANNDKVSVITSDSTARASKYKMLLKSLEEEEANKKKVDVDVVWGNYDDDEAAQAEAEPVDDEALSESASLDDAEHFDDGDDQDSDDDDHEEDEDDDKNKKKKMVKNKTKKKNKKSKKGKKKAQEIGDESQDEDLDLLMLDVNARPTSNHKFDPNDERFKAIYESGLYNIDPSHPAFKRTEAFEQIAEQKRAKRQKRR